MRSSAPLGRALPRARRPHWRTLLPALFRRRVVWVPTLWGALSLLVAALLLLVLLVSAMPSFLGVSAPARGARVLVVEGWLEDRELDQAAAIFRAGHYERIVTTGGPIESWFGAPPPWKDFADRSARYLAAHGLAGAKIDAVGAPASAQDRTFLSAVVFREWAARNAIPVDRIDLVTVGTHARRSRAMFRAALGPDTEVGVISLQPGNHELQRWWATSAGAKAVLGETIAYAWTACCFWPPPRGSHEERWAVPPAQAAAPSAAVSAATAKLP